MINEPLYLPEREVPQTGIGAFGLTSPNPTRMPDLRELAENVAKNVAVDYIGRKVGLEQLGSILSTMGSISNPLGLSTFGPAGIGIGALQSINQSIQNSTFGRSSTIAGYLEAKRAEKAARKDAERDKQGDIQTVDLRGRQNLADTYANIGATRDGEGGNNNSGGLNSGGREGYGGGGQYR